MGRPSSLRHVNGQRAVGRNRFVFPAKKKCQTSTCPASFLWPSHDTKEVPVGQCLRLVTLEWVTRSLSLPSLDMYNDAISAYAFEGVNILWTRMRRPQEISSEIWCDQRENQT